MAKKKRVVITGVGVVSPYGVGNKVFWDGIKNGKSGLSNITQFDVSGFRSKKGGEVRGFDIKKHLKMKGLRHLVKSAEFAIVASKLALADGKISVPLKRGISESCGVVLGTLNGTMKSILSLHEEILLHGPRGINPFAFPNISPNAIPSHISIQFNIKGFNACIISDAATGMDALSYTANMIKEHGYKLGLAGSSDSLSEEMFAGSYLLRVLAGSILGKREISCPYDSRRNGIILSEGCAVFLVEDMENAVKRKAKIYAEIKGFGSSFDPKTHKGYSPDAKGAISSMRIALDDAECDPENIDCIIGSANSLRGGDRTEAVAVNRVFKGKTGSIPITSIKGSLGYTFGASSSLDIASALFSLRESVIPPTINYRKPDTGCRRLNVVANKPIKKKMNRIMINSFTTGGFNSAMIVERVRGK
ncbi:MAG: beta-ketoacyl-[acyl-carrier-protein] synthase family protein [Candidatus Omnitrophota bacterium]